MRRMKMNIDPDLGDLEEMLAHVQTQLEKEIDINHQEAQSVSLTNVQESPRMVRRTASFNRTESQVDYRRAHPKPPLARVNSDINSGSMSLNGHLRGSRQSLNPRQNGCQEADASQNLQASGDRGSHSSFQSFRSEPSPRHSGLSLQHYPESRSSENGRSKTATLPKGFGSPKEKNWEEYWSHEQSISSARASVMMYDDSVKRWVPSGSSSGLSKVHIYQHTQHNTFRVVGRKLNDHEVVINCGIVRGLKYNQATATFHQWRDARHVYGLNFSCREDADSFARAMMHTLEVLSSKPAGNTAPPAPQPANPPVPHNAHTYDEDMGYRTMTREDAAILQQPQYHQPQHQNNHQPYHPQHSQYHAPHQNHHQSVGAPAPPPHGVHHTLPHPPSQQTPGHHRTNSAPMPPNLTLSTATVPTPPAPPPVPPHQNLTHSNGPVAPPTPPAAPQPPPMLQQPAVVSPPPPPPPPPAPPAPDPAGLAAQLQQARLKRANKQQQQQQATNNGTGQNSPPAAQEHSGSSTSSGGSAGRSNAATPMHSMMHEMARTLARRRAHIDRTEVTQESSTDTSASGANTPLKSWERAATLPHRLPATCNGNSPAGEAPAVAPQSPRSVRKRFGSASEETILKQVNGGGETPCVSAAEWESFKQELLKEMKTQIGQMKKEILDAMKAEFARR